MCVWLRRAWERIEFLEHFWREQMAMLHLAGYRWSKDRILRPEQYSPLRSNTRQLRRRWNWCPGDPGRGSECSFAHAAGMENRAEILKRWASGGPLEA